VRESDPLLFPYLDRLNAHGYTISDIDVVRPEKL